MKCPRCGERNDEGYRFCRHCGGALPEASEAERPPGLPLPPAMEQSPAAAVVATPRTYKLTATVGLLSGRTFTIGQKGLLIGRDPSNCQVVLADDEISRLHAWVGLNERGEPTIRDCNSANGTFVNQVRIQERVLRPTDEIALGSGRRQLFRVEPAAPLVPGVGPTEQIQAGGLRPMAGGTSVFSAAELETHPEEVKAAPGTVAIKLTDLLARPHLELIVDKFAVRTLEIPEAGLSVGRDSSRCQLVMEHPSVSGVHAVFSSQNGRAVLTDRSTNGTFVNGQRVSVLQLHDGDYITFGRYAGKSLIYRTGLEPELRIEKVDLSKDRVTIGRDPSNDVVIDHPIVSNRHAEIVKQDGRVFVMDRGSTNGTFVNGIKIKRHQLQQLDRIVIGPSELQFTGASLSHTPDGRVVRLDVRDVSYRVRDRTTGKPKLLLDDISLVIKPRELIGLLGPSGAGKSTLMNTLNGFIKPASGGIRYNGVDLYENLPSLKSTIGFVPQDDIVHKQISVRRCLYYAAKLRLPEDLSEEEIRRRVEEMLETLKIDRERWENPVSTLSGGQRKRVSIGIELLSKPGVLFLDEPTAGLDPRTETLMMMLFRQLANQGSTIVITTHLLASFGVLDKVVVLVQGRLAFYGPGTKFLEYFKAESPPDVYDDLTDNNSPTYAQELKKRFAESSLYKEMIASSHQAAKPEKAPGVPPPEAEAKDKGFSLNQFKVLAKRAWELKFSDPGQTFLLFSQAPLVALLVALMASQKNQVQTIFMAMFGALWFGCSNSVREIVDEQTIYRRERQTGLKIPSYIFSKLAVLSLIALAQCVSFVVVLMAVHHALWLSTGGEVLGAILILFLVGINGTLIGLVISSLVNSPEKALTLFPLVLIPELLLSGLFLPVSKIQTIIPITVDQLFEGRMFAPPEAKAKAKGMTNPPPPANAETSAEAAAREGELAHQVVGAMAPSPGVQKAFQKYTPGPVAGMPPAVRWLSVLAVSRWGLEALSDLCIHGSHSTQDYAYKIINTVYISLHPEDVEKLEKGLEAPAEAFERSGSFPLPSAFWKDKSPYLAILIGFVLLMTATVLIVIKRKDVA